MFVFFFQRSREKKSIRQKPQFFFLHFSLVGLSARAAKKELTLLAFYFFNEKFALGLIMFIVYAHKDCILWKKKNCSGKLCVRQRLLAGFFAAYMNFFVCSDARENPWSEDNSHNLFKLISKEYAFATHERGIQNIL